MSINLKLVAGSVLLAAIALATFVAVHRSQDLARDQTSEVFARGLVPILGLEEAFARIDLLAARRAVTADDGEPAARNAELLSTLGEVLAMAAEAGAILPEASPARRAVEEIRFSVSRLRAAEGSASERLVGRELGEISSRLSEALSLARAEARTARDAANASLSEASRNHLAGLGILLGSLFLLAWLLAADIGAGLRRALAAVQVIGEGREPTAGRFGFTAFRELDRALATLGARLAERARAADAQRASASTRLEEEIARLERRFAATIDKMQEGYCLLDEKRNLVAANAPFRRLFETLAPGATMKDLAADPALASVLSARSPDVVVQETGDGRTLEVRRHAVSGRSTIIIVDDVTERKAANRTIERLAGCDALTGLPNRARFQEQLGTVLSSRNRAHDVAVMTLDIQGFGEINSAHGDAVGDLVLRATAERLASVLSDRDFLARIGSDEFAILQSHAGQPDGCEALARTILELFDSPLPIESVRLTPGLAIGMVHLERRGGREPLEASAVMRDAQMAMAMARTEKRGGYRLFSDTIRRQAETRRKMESDLVQAVEKGQFEVYYQPFTDVRRGAVAGFEALLRWNHPTRGMVGPSGFVPVAEEMGLIGEIGGWILREACRAAAGWPSPLSISVNLSAIQFHSPMIVDEVRTVLAETGLAPRRLQLEVTESVFLGDVAGTLDKLSALRDLGVSLSMDDFGTGYSSLGYLSRFPFDKLKIDKGFVRDMEKPENAAIIKAVISLSSSMGMSVIAEGVETRAQFEALCREGCGEMQGFFFGRPGPASELARHIARIDGSFADGELPRLGQFEDRRFDAA